MVGHAIPPEWNIAKVVGHAAECDGDLVAVGCVTWDRYGRCWGWFSWRERLSPFLIHRKAVAMLDLLRDCGEPAVHAICNRAIPGAEMWLRRLGFERDPALDMDMGPGWRRIL